MLKRLGGWSKLSLIFAVLLVPLLGMAGCGSSGDSASGTIPATGSTTPAGTGPSASAQTSQPAGQQANDTPDQVLQAFCDELQSGNRTAVAGRVQGLTTWGGFGLNDMAGLVKFSNVSYNDLSNDGATAVVHFHGYMTYKEKNGAYSTQYAVNGDTTLAKSGTTWKITRLPAYLPPDYMGNPRSIN